MFNGGLHDSIMRCILVIYLHAFLVGYTLYFVDDWMLLDQWIGMVSASVNVILSNTQLSRDCSTRLATSVN